MQTLQVQMGSQQSTQLGNRQRQQASFLRNLLADRPSQRRSFGIAGEVSRRFGVGSYADDAAVIAYGEQDFLRARQRLEDWGQPTGPTPAWRPRPEFAIAVTAPPVATSRPAASSGSVAVQLLNAMDFRVPAHTEYLVMPASQAAKLSPDLILVVESLSCLARLRDFGWLRPIVRQRPTLAVFGGRAFGDFRSPVVQQLLSQRTEPVVALYDFSPAGLIAAKALPRVEALALPAPEILERLATQDSGQRKAFTNSMRAHWAALEKARHPHIASAWELLRRLGGGVPATAFPS